MEQFEVEELEICPWALREGLILRRLDQLVHDGPLEPPAHIGPIQSERRRSERMHPSRARV
jgi:exopolyphosphatase/guanosine-5'-triphosphate,3'-diphosphate pyrophosphatase